jgi:hypothetical protein
MTSTVPQDLTKSWVVVDESMRASASADVISGDVLADLLRPSKLGNTNIDDTEQQRGSLKRAGSSSKNSGPDDISITGTFGSGGSLYAAVASVDKYSFIHFGVQTSFGKHASPRASMN